MSDQETRLEAFLVLITTNNQEQFKKAYSYLTNRTVKNNGVWKIITGKNKNKNYRY